MAFRRFVRIDQLCLTSSTTEYLGVKSMEFEAWGWVTSCNEGLQHLSIIRSEVGEAENRLFTNTQEGVSYRYAQFGMCFAGCVVWTGRRW